MVGSNIKGTYVRPDDLVCATVRGVLTRVGDTWSMLVIVLLGAGTRRFNEIRREIEGISQRMLALTLRGLERDGLAVRRVFPANPPSVTYTLTPLGQTLLKTFMELAKWAIVNRDEIEKARAAFDQREVAQESQANEHVIPERNA